MTKNNFCQQITKVKHFCMQTTMLPKNNAGNDDDDDKQEEDKNHDNDITKFPLYNCIVKYLNHSPVI